MSPTSVNDASAALPRSLQDRHTRSSASLCCARTRLDSLRSTSSASRAALRAASEGAGPSMVARARLRACRSLPTATIVLACDVDRSPIRSSSALRAARRVRSVTSWTMPWGERRVRGDLWWVLCTASGGSAAAAAHHQLVDLDHHCGAPSEVRGSQAAGGKAGVGLLASFRRRPALARRLPLLRLRLLEAGGRSVEYLHVLARDSHVARRRRGLRVIGSRRRSRACRRALSGARSHSPTGGCVELSTPERGVGAMQAATWTAASQRSEASTDQPGRAAMPRGLRSSRRVEHAEIRVAVLHARSGPRSGALVAALGGKERLR